MPYDNNDIMQNVPERLRSKVKGIGLPEQMPQIQQESDTSFLQDLPLPGGTSLNTVAELTSNAIDSIKETNVYKKYFYNDAEKLAEAQKISNDLKIPVNAILANDTNMEKARDIYAYKQKQQQIMPNGEKTFDMKAVYAAYPELQRLANMDETQAAIALHNIENVKQTHGIIEAFKTGWHMDSLQLEHSKLGQKGYFGELTEADRKRLTEIEEEMKNAKVLPDLLEAPVESIVGNTAQQAPMMFRQFMNGQMLAIGGAVAGAAVGATGGFTVGGITAVPGAAYGARVGYGIGARLGYAKEMYQEILGNYYLDYIGYKDRQGRQLMSDNQARAWATVSALAETGIEMANVESVIGILGSEPGTKAAANIVRDIVRRGADSASAKAQLKDWIINNARHMGVVALSESAEEGVQNAVSMGINTMAAKANPGGNIPSYSAVEMAQGAMEGAWQALPASIGFGAMAAAGSNLKYVRKVATAANEGREYVENARKNEAGITMVDNLLNNKAANKLAKEQPEVYKNIIKNTLEGTGAENVYVDTELLLQQDGGVQILNQLAAAAGIEGQALQDVIETKADIAVPVQEYVNIDGAQELHDKLRDLISFAVGADCFARTRRIAQQMKKTYDKMIAGEMERALQNVHNLVEANFEEGPQRDMAEFILGQYEDPMEGIKEYRAERQRELDEMLEPVLATMREGMGQGVAMLKDEETGHYYRMSNNDPWYSKYYAQNKKAPSQSEMKQIAEDILTGNNYYGVPGFEFRDEESMEYAEANRAQIESIRSELATLDAIEEKIGNISKGELAATEGLTPEGIRVYNRVIEALKGASSKAVRKQEAMGALLTAHHAERYAEAMRRAGYKNYTAEDYLNRIRFEVNGNNAASGRFNQAAVYDWPQKAASNIVNITGNEFGEYENIKELRETAKKYYRTNLQGTTVYNPLIGEVRIERGLPDEKLLFSNRGLKEMVNKSANPIKLLAVKQLREIIENSRFLTHEESHEDKHAGEYFYYLHSKVNFNGEDHYVIVDIKEDIHGGMMYYTHNIFTEEEYRKENKKREDAKLATPKPRISSPGVEKQQASSFNNIITENGEVYNQSAYHGTPHSFEQFDLGAIGTGEGNQADGWGLYFAADKKIADERYRKRLTNNQYVIETDEATYYFDIEKQDWVDKKTGQPVGGMGTPLGYAVWQIGFREGNVQAELKDLKGQRDALIEENDSSNARRLDFLMRTIKLLEKKKFNYRKDNGSLFEVDIPENDVLLDEDKSIEEQPSKVREIIEKELERIGSSASNGKQFYNEIVFEFTRQGSENPQRAASEYLNRLGIKGITYEGARDGRCFVIFDDKAISIINRYNQTAYHGTPYSFEKFDLGAIGSGEGAQVHGWGLYFAKNRRIANKYKEVLGITHGIVQAGDITYTVNEDGEWLNTQTEEEVVYGTPLSYALTEYETAGSKHKAIENLKKDIAERQATDTDAAKKFVTAANEAIKILENNDFKVHNTPTVIEVDVPENKVLLDEQKPFKAQLKNVQKLITKAIQELPEVQQLRFWESLIQRQLGDSDKTIKSRSELNNKKSLITSLQNLNNKNRPAHLKRATLYNLKSDGYTDEQINELQKDNQKLEREIEKYNAEIPALEEALNAAQEEDVKRNKEKIKQASANPAEALQSNLDTGEKIYQAFAYAVGGGEYNYRKASEYLNSQGIKGITYDGQQDGRCFVVFDDKAINIINRYNQSAGIHARTANRGLLNEAQAMAAEEKARISTRMERNRQKGNTQYDEILRDYTERLPEELQPVAKEYVDLIKRPLAERDFDRETEIEEKLLDNEIASEFYNKISDSQWEAAGTGELQKEYDETVFLPEKADAVVIFNDNLVASYSMAEPQVQGQTAILDNGRRIIYLYENADQSTFMHEMAHIFFADMRELAEMENAPAQIKRDWQTLQDWTAWNGAQINEYIGTAVYNEFNQRDKEIRAALEEGYTYRGGERIELGTLLEEWRQERFARGFEEYLRKGKAPKESLKGVFTRFKNWLLKIYKDIKTIGAEPTKEVKAVMDRMLATQEEIDAVMQKEDIDAFRKAGGFKYLSGTSAEMWQKIYDDIHKDAYSKVIKVAMQDLTEQGQKEREQKIADERAAARERMSQEPVFIVWQYLQNNPQLDKEATAQQIGNMTAEQYDFELNERGGSLDAAVDNYMRAYERELDAAAPDKAELARRAEEAVDTSYYKKLLTAYELEALDKSVQAEQKASRKINDTADAGAAQAINRLDRERARREGYEEEIKRLREQRSEERKQQRALRDVAVGNVDTIREYAERKISTLPVMEAANPVMWKKLSRQKARETEEAIAKNDWETARKAKKEQLVYDVMTDLATGNKKFVDKAVSTMKRRADIIRRDKNLGANDRYVYNHLLYVFGLAKRDAPIPPDYEGFVKTIVNYDQNLELTFIDTDGTVLLPDWLLNAGTATRPRDKGYIDLNVDDFKLLKDVMDNIYTAGREAKMAKAVTDRDGKKIDLDEAAAEIVATVIDTAFKKKSADRKFGDESKIEMAARLAEEASMSRIKPETILQAMGDTAMRYIYDPMREAANTEMRMNETLRQQQADIFAAYHDGKVAKYLAQGMGEKEARAAAEKELNEMGSKKQYSIGKENITKENLLAIALNWGTDINRKRVVDGYQVSYGFIEHALRQLDAADWQFVQNIWELFETYWPDLQRVEANVTGVTLEKQPAVPFQIIGADGGVYNLNGGYYPLKYDPRKNIRTSQREADEAARVNMQGASRLGMNLGNTKERVLGHVGLSIRTDLGVIDEALTDTVHNIAMRETVRDVIRLINNNEVVQAINENWGAATWRTLNVWALDCWAAEPRTKSIYEKASQWLRTRQTQAVLGFRASTALMNICNIGPMMAYVGPAEAVKAINRFYAHPQRQYNTIMAKSVFLRNRAETMDRDFGRLVKDNSNSAITKSAFWLITKTDLMLACPLWMHEYQKAYQDGIAKGVDPVNVEAAAVRAGDAAVRRVFGSGQTVDMAEIQRGNEFTKQLTMFYSYFSVMHNAIVLKVWEARKARVDGKKLTQAMAPVLTGIIFWMAIPAVIEAGISAMIDDDDDDLADVAKGAGITFISTAVGGIPVLRDALPMALKAAAGEPVYNIRNNPLNETAAQMLNVTRAINSDNKDALDVAKAVLRMADMITGLPQILTDGMITAARWIDEGNLSEEDIQHYLWSILFGKNSKKN